MEYFTGRRLQAIAIISAIVVSTAAGAFFALGNRQAYSQESATLASSPTIKVTGDATTSLVPDQATLIVNVQTQPDDLVVVLAEQDEKIAEIRAAVQSAIGEDATVTVGQRNMYPYYSGYGTPVSDEVTFNIYATTTIETNIDRLSDLVNALAEEDFGFESVYIDPQYSAQLLNEAGAPEGEEDNATLTGTPITIGVNLSTPPAVLTEAIEEYEEKYRTLLGVLEELGIPEDQIQNNNFNIYPYYYGSSQANGYQANTQVIIKTDPTNIDAVSRAVREVDSAFVENVFISVSDVAIDEARKDLTDQAIANARERASEMVDALGLEVTGIKSIEAATGSSNQYGGEVQYRGVKIVQPYYYQNIGGDISVSVTVEFELVESGEE